MNTKTMECCHSFAEEIAAVEMDYCIYRAIEEEKKGYSELEEMFICKWRFMKGIKDRYISDRLYAIYLRPQSKVGTYRVDFVIKNSGVKIAIELDGFKYHDRDKDQFKYERERQNYLICDGYIVLRYTWDMIAYDFYSVYNEILSTLDRAARKIKNGA